MNLNLAEYVYSLSEVGYCVLDFADDQITMTKHITADQAPVSVQVSVMLCEDLVVVLSDNVKIEYLSDELKTNLLTEVSRALKQCASKPKSFRYAFWPNIQVKVEH